MSVFLENEFPDHGLTVEHVVHNHEGYGVGSLSAGEFRDQKQLIARDPITDSPKPHPCDPVHGVVVGSKTGKRRSRLAKKADVRIQPETYSD